MNGLAQIFEHYPLGIVEHCCDVFNGIAALEKFPPAPSEVRRWCDLHTAAALAIIRRGEPKPERAPYGDEHCATMRGRLQKLLHELFDKKTIPAEAE